MSKTLIEKLTSTPEGMRLYQQERAIQDVTDLICEVMDEEHVSRSQLAGHIGKTKGYVTQLLDGRANMTVRTISDVFCALGRAIHFQDGPLDATVNASPVFSINVGSDWGKQFQPWTPNVVVTGAPPAITDQLVG